MYQNIIIAQVLLTLVLGLWIAAKFRDTPFIRFFGRNDWFVGSFLILVGYVNYSVYAMTYLKSMNTILMVIGVILLSFSITDILKE